MTKKVSKKPVKKAAKKAAKLPAKKASKVSKPKGKAADKKADKPLSAHLRSKAAAKALADAERVARSFAIRQAKAKEKAKAERAAEVAKARKAATRARAQAKRDTVKAKEAEKAAYQAWVLKEKAKKAAELAKERLKAKKQRERSKKVRQAEARKEREREKRHWAKVNAAAELEAQAAKEAAEKKAVKAAAEEAARQAIAEAKAKAKPEKFGPVWEKDPRPFWAKAKELAGGWKKLAAELDVTLPELQLWRKDFSDETREWITNYIAGAEERASKMATFNALHDAAVEQGKLEDWATQRGRRDGPLTTGYYWTRNFNRQITPQLIEEVGDWIRGIKGRDEWPMWHGTGPIEQFGEGERIGSSKVTMVIPGVSESKNYTVAYLPVPKCNSKDDLASHVEQLLEDILEVEDVAFLVWMKVVNYRWKTDDERRAYERQQRKAQEEWKKQNAKTASLSRWRQGMLGSTKVRKR